MPRKTDRNQTLAAASRGRIASLSRINLLLGGLCVATTAALLAFLAGRNPYEEEIFPPCGFARATGWLCPGCGGTRAFYSLAQGNLPLSIAENPVVVAITASILLVAIALNDWFYRSFSRVSAAFIWIAPIPPVTALVYSGLIRNIL